MMFKLFGHNFRILGETYALMVDCSAEQGKKAVEAFIIGPDDRADFQGIRYVTSESIQEYEMLNGPIVDFDRLAQDWITDRLWFRVYEEARKQGVTDLLRDPIQLRQMEVKDLHNIWALGRSDRDLAHLRDGTQKGDLRTLLRRLLALTHPVADPITPREKG